MTRKQAVACLTATVLLVTAGLCIQPAGASVSTQLQTAQDNLANCQLLAADRGATSTQRQWARDCVSAQQRIITLLTRGTPSPTVPPTTTPPSSTPTPVPSATKTPGPTPTPAPTITTTTPPSPGWPGADNTGVPSGTVLTPWTGSCTTTTPNLVIDAKVITCSPLSIRAANVQITRSKVVGRVDNDSQPGSFSLVDSEVDLPGTQQLRVVIGHDITMLRTEVTGGNGGVWCLATCDIRDSWIHGQRIKDNWHASAVRMEQGLTLVHNTVVCDAPVQPDPEGSCSASLTGYGDYAPVRDNLIQGNYFPATQYAAYCAYGGSSKGKPYSDAAANIRFIDNVFAKPCALYGPIGDWNPSAPGNVWTNNRYVDGTVIPNRVS